MTQSLDYPAGNRYHPVAKELARLGHQVRILALHPAWSSLPQKSLVVDSVPVTYVAPMHVRQVGNRRLYYSPVALFGVAAWATLAMAVRLLTNPGDIVHVGKPHPMNGLAALVAGHLLHDRPLYLDCDDYEARVNRFAGTWQQWGVAAVENILPRWARGITVNTRFQVERLAALGYPRERIVYVPNGVDRERFALPDAARVRALRARWNLEGRQAVVYVGSLSVTSHAVDLLVEAFARVRCTLPDAVLLLVGGGEDYDMVASLIGRLGLDDCVRLVGRVPFEEVPYYYALGDVTVDPVRDDVVSSARCPLKIFESMALGVPVVTGDVGDRRELLGDGQAGLVVPPGDIAALAEGLVSVLANPDQAAALSQAARTVRERYYWDVLVHEWMQVYSLS